MMKIDSGKMQAEYSRCRELIDHRLEAFFNEECPYSTLLESMRYSLLAGGKRIRAVMCMKFCEASDGDASTALDAACAIEMLHAYSLIHDDLPCMDDDDMRRGKPSNHIRFGESTAMLAGDALQAAVFETIMNCDLPAGAVVEIGRIIARTAGPHGICGGQFLDLGGTGKQLTPTQLMEINILKTASLISASARIGVAAGSGTPEQAKAADEYALAIGLAFQIRDDVLDHTSTQEILGKPIGSDAKSSKATFATVLGVGECEKMIREETEKAVAALGGKFSDSVFLTWFAHMLAGREY